MKLTLRPTDQIVNIETRITRTEQGFPARIWEGHDEHGFPVVAFITRVAVHEREAPEVHERFRRELQECEKLTPSAVWDLRYFID